jgi:hypothetical protein
MGKGAKAKVLSLGLILAVLFFYLPQVLKAQVAGKGNLIGFVYDQDGTTPVAGAVVMVKNISNGRVFQSSRSDNLGVFKVQGLDTGLYALGVTAVAGDFNSGELVGVAANETSKVAIAISPYEKDVMEAVQQVNKDQQEKGESRIGHVVGFNSGSREADVFIERGLLQSGDRIHVKGESTDFYQDAKALKIQGAGVRKALAGQNCMLPFIKPAVAGDVVYVVCKRGIPPFFLAPLGIAAVIAGSAVLTPTGEEITASPFKNK